MLKKEKWINGYKNVYSIQEDGIVRSYRINFNSPKILSTSINSNGYEVVHLDKTPKTVHRIVAEHFIINKNNKCCVNHIDGDKTNNTVENLEWVTHSENSRHAWKNGLNSVSADQKSKASELGKTKRSLSMEKAIQIRRIYFNSRYTQNQIAEHYGVNRKTIDGIVQNRTYKEAVSDELDLEMKYRKINIKDF